MNSKIVLFLVGLIIIIFLIDIITNKEKFAMREEQMAAYLGGSADNISILKVKSIVSKIDGTKLNIEINDNSLLQNDVPVPDLVDIKIKTDTSGKYLGIDNSGLTNDDNEYLWELHKIDSQSKINTLLGNRNRNGFGQKVSNINYPFFMVLGKNEHNFFALQYNYGRVMVENIGNYDRQKWDLSEKAITENQLVIKNMYDTIIGPVSSGNRDADPNRIKINLNVNDDKIKQLLNIDTYTPPSSGGSKCDTYIPKTALKSLCPGCDY